MTKNIFLGAAIVILAGGSFMLGYGYRSRFDSQRIEKVRTLLNEGPKNVVGGKVLEVNASGLKIRIDDPLAGTSAEKQVAVSPETRLLKITVKSAEEKAADLADYQKKIQNVNSIDAVKAPSILKEVTIKLSDIQVNDFVDVFSEYAIGDGSRIEAAMVKVEFRPNQ